MASDRARISFDRTRLYRSVLAQQGRVTLEADINEAATIASETLRRETLEVVGAVGTPDDGYEVAAGKRGPFSVSIGPGTMYLGGWRLELDAPVEMNAQPDWLDRVSPPRPGAKTRELIALLATEQSVTAVEDRALREVALGGPDSTARTRLMQHFLRLPVEHSTCEAVFQKDVSSQLAADGVKLDPRSVQLVPLARLQVGFVTQGSAGNACEPPASGGYLGADNQLIRVAPVGFDPKTKAGQLVWAYDNASTLYRVQVKDTSTIELESTPLDAEHSPQQGQAIELLRVQADLGNGNLISAASGFVASVRGYAPDILEVTLDAPLPEVYAKPGTQLFLRLWRGVQPFVAGQPTTLMSPSAGGSASIGVTVTLTMDVLSSSIAARPFWHFAVRPSTPVNVYPARYQTSPQPPDGPRQWLCDLAVIGWRPIYQYVSQLQLLDDCRLHFEPLVQIKPSQSCGIVVGPADVEAAHGLQAIVDALSGVTATVTLTPGIYPLSAPLKLDERHAGLVLEGCEEHGVRLVTHTGSIEAFAAGMVIVTNTSQVILRRLHFDMPLVALPQAAVPATQAILHAFWSTDNRISAAAGSCGIRLVASTDIRVEGCEFNFVPKTQPEKIGTLAIGVMALGNCTGVSLAKNRFAFRVTASTNAVLLGFAHSVGNLGADAEAPDVSAVLDEAELGDNEFLGATVAIFAFARLGSIRCVANRVRGGVAGFYFANSDLGRSSSALRESLTRADPKHAERTELLNRVVQPLVLSAATQFAAVLPSESDPIQPSTVTLSPNAREAFVGQFKAAMHTVLDALPVAAAPVQAAPAKPARPAKGAKRAGAAAITAPPPTAADVRTLASLDSLLSIAAHVASVESKLTPSLTIRQNDIDVLTRVGSDDALPALGSALLSTVQILFDARTSSDTPTVFAMVQDNRIRAVFGSRGALVIFFANAVVATSNLLLQARVEGTQAACAFIASPAEPPPLHAVAGNAVQGTLVVVPERSTNAVASSWRFLNTSA